jgi:hypothetical protein
VRLRQSHLRSGRRLRCVFGQARRGGEDAEAGQRSRGGGESGAAHRRQGGSRKSRSTSPMRSRRAPPS